MKLLSAIYIVLIVAILAILYKPTLTYPPVFDDSPKFMQVTDGPCNMVCKTANIAKAFWVQLIDLKSLQSRYIQTPTFEAWGQNIRCHHIFSVFLNILVAISVFLYFTCLFHYALYKKTFYTPIRRTIFSILASAWFIFNPCSVFGVAYVIQQTIEVATLFSVLSLLTYILALNAKYIVIRLLLMVVSLFLYKAGYMGKEHSAILPLVMFAHYLFFFQKVKYSRWKYIVEGLIFYIGTAYLVYHYIPYLSAMHYTEPYEKAATGLAKITTGVDITQSLHFWSAITQGKFFFVYLSKWLFPVGLSIDLKYPILHSQIFWGFLYALYPLIPLYLLFRRGTKSLLGLGLLIPYLFNLVEITCSSRIAEQFVLYRSYLWMFGFFAFVPYVFKNIPTRELAIFTILLIGVLGYGYNKQLDAFATDKAIWLQAVENLPESKEDRVWGSVHALNSLGQAYQHENNIDSALKYYDEALAVDPNYSTALSNKATALRRRGGFVEAKELLLKALSLGETSGILLNLGVAEQDLGNLGAAEGYYKKAIAVNDDNAKYAKYDLAKMYASFGQCDLALPLAKESGIAYAKLIIEQCTKGE